MTTHQENLAALLTEYNLVAGLVVASDGSTLAQVGDLKAANFESLASALIGPYGDARVTFDSLEGQPLPRIWAQGESFAVVDKPSAEFMVIVFGSGVSGIEQQAISKRVSLANREKWITRQCNAPCGYQGSSES